MNDNLSLFHATIEGDLQLVKLMIEKGCDVNLQDPRNDMTALHFAVQFNNTEIGKVLLENGADVSAKCYQSCTPLYYLNQLSDLDKALEIVEMFVGQNIPLKTDSYINILRSGSEEMVKVILNSSIDLFERDSCDRTPIHYLAQNKNDGVIDLLYGKEFDVNESDYDYMTPLHYAAKAGLPSSVEFLLNNEADPNYQDCHSMTPLYTALSAAQQTRHYAKYRDVIELLLEYGADPQLTPPEFQYIVKNMLLSFQFRLLQPVIGHLVLIEKQLKTNITSTIIKVFKFHTITRHFFEICRKQLNTLEAIKINDSLTLYQLLISSNSTIEHYARDPDIVLKIKSICVNEQSYRPFGLKIRKRFIKALKMANLRKEAAFAFCDLNRLDYNRCCLFVEEIISYLSHIDLQRLCEV